MRLGRIGAAVLASLLAYACGGTGSARAATGTAVGAVQPEGYARMVFTFDQLPKSTTTLTNGVLVIRFAEPVTLDAETLVRGLGDLIGVVRRDPDGASLRFALTKPAKLDVIEAGEQLYVDLLPANWVGMPPGLPKDVIAGLTREARSARAAKADAERGRKIKLSPLELEGASHPTFRRLVFGLDDGVPVDMKRAGDRVSITIGAPLPFDLAAAKALLPTEFSAIDVKRTATTLVVSAPAPQKVDVRGFRDAGAYILDIDRDDAGATTGAVAPHADASPHMDATTAHAAPDGAPVATVHADAAAAAAPSRSIGHEAPLQVAGPAAPKTPEIAAPVQPAMHDVEAAPAASPSAPSQAAEPTRGTAEVRKAGDTLRVVFPFAKTPPAAAVFLRGRTVWALFDDPRPIATDGVVEASGGAIVAIEQREVDNGRLIRMRLRDPRLITAATEAGSWIVSLGDDVLGSADGIVFAPDFARAGRAALAARLDGAGVVRWLTDPDVGDRLVVTTAPSPLRALLRPQTFVEFALLATAQGVVVTPIADDLRVVAGLDDLRIERDRGLLLSSDGSGAKMASADVPAAKLVFDKDDAAEAVTGPYFAHERRLLDIAALAPPEERTAARLALARFYAFRHMAAESKAVLETIVTEDGLAQRDPTIALLRVAADADLGRTKLARAVLDAPELKGVAEASLWRALVEQKDGRPGPARDALADGEPALDALPSDLKSRFTELEVTLALDARDQAKALAAFDQLEVLPAIRGVGAREVLRGRVLEALGQTDKALAAYAAIAKGVDPIPAAEATLRSIELGLAVGRLSTPDAIAGLERLVTGWRGDWIEAEALAKLAGLYGDAERWRDAFATLKVSVEAFPDVEDTRLLQDRMQERFTDLFLGPAVDRMPKLDALALFYDFQDLSPGGKRGDELVRRLADKLVEVDLLDQAAQLLEYQIDNRLTGAARAQVAARAALVELMNGKPTEAARLLQKTRQADLPASLVRTRLLLEARALAQSGRTELALEMTEGLEGSEGSRLRSDILWAAHRWGEAGEAIEASLGTAWRKADPLDRAERADVMRAAIALSLADDGLGLDRIRQKFAPKMADSADSHAFEVVTAPIEARGDAFREIARSIATTATLEGFLKEYRRRSAEDAAAPMPAPKFERSAEATTPGRG